MKSSLRIGSLAIVSFAPLFAFAQYETVGSIGGMFIDLINGVLVPLLFAVAFITFIYGVAKAYIIGPSTGDSEAVNKGHTLILWGIVGFAVMLSLWGLVNVVTNTFGLTGVGAPYLPKSY